MLKKKQTKKFERVVYVRIFKTQLKEMDEQMKNYPDLWNGHSHFVRASINYFLRHIKSDAFRISYLEDLEAIR